MPEPYTSDEYWAEQQKIPPPPPRRKVPIPRRETINNFERNIKNSRINKLEIFNHYIKKWFPNASYKPGNKLVPKIARNIHPNKHIGASENIQKKADIITKLFNQLLSNQRRLNR